MQKIRGLGRGFLIGRSEGGRSAIFYFGGVKMKKLGWGRNEWVAHFYVVNTKSDV
ncbi:hypothetical protein FC13_GL000273 [Lacticaseibacillus casei DSM 20011 = JCM 1134 = ATCC 393]|nr:hypothetical protein FC13_GL000273 [Lacticaseibacillus casei DSM 20011 = JCM 1134 = ATCC 393]